MNDENDIFEDVVEDEADENELDEDVESVSDDEEETEEDVTEEEADLDEDEIEEAETEDLTEETTSENENEEQTTGKETELDLLKKEIEELKKQLSPKQEEENKPQQPTQEATHIQQVWDQDLKAIKELYPSVNALTIKELGAEFLGLMKTGMYTSVEAYEISHRKELVKMKEKAAAEKAVKNTKSKEHLKGGGTGSMSRASDIPTKIYNMYKSLLPDASDIEIAKHYEKSKND